MGIKSSTAILSWETILQPVLQAWYYILFILQKPATCCKIDYRISNPTNLCTQCSGRPKLSNTEASLCTFLAISFWPWPASTSFKLWIIKLICCKLWVLWPWPTPYWLCREDSSVRVVTELAWFQRGIWDRYTALDQCSEKKDSGVFTEATGRTW